ncbi:MAG TPA: class I SAM-dependent methyltransferase [Edaphobacter sp.]|nr:class I SAM-dependent methyltransferase [Edaphobacter sp.]
MAFFADLPSVWRRIQIRIAVMRAGRLKSFELYLPYLQGKSGLEIGGPSGIFGKGKPLPVYEEIGRLDNCDFSKSTVWAKHSETFLFNPKKATGNTIFCDGSDLVDVQNSSFDVILSAHNLEHFANPVKALKEWQRVLKPNGALILVLPNYRETFDHLRLPTKVNHMFDDYEQNTGEDDLSHLPEILEKHDLKRDPAAGSKQEFHRRSLDNLLNRCLHHHVFDEHNSHELLSKVGFEVITVESVAPFHICLLARRI